MVSHTLCHVHINDVVSTGIWGEQHPAGRSWQRAQAVQWGVWSGPLDGALQHLGDCLLPPTQRLPWLCLPQELWPTGVLLWRLGHCLTQPLMCLLKLILCKSFPVYLLHTHDATCFHINVVNFLFQGRQWRSQLCRLRPSSRVDGLHVGWWQLVDAHTKHIYHQMLKFCILTALIKFPSLLRKGKGRWCCKINT